MAIWPAKRKVVVSVADDTYLAHHGILGMKWGVRRWQNADGSYNAAGKLRYGDGPKKNTRKAAAKSSQSSKSAAKKKTASQAKNAPAQSAQPNQPKPVSEMTDQEIRDFLSRRDLEARYLAAITPKQQEKAESLTHKYMAQFGTKLADKIVQDAATQLGASIVKSILGDNKNDNKDEKKKESEKKTEKKVVDSMKKNDDTARKEESASDRANRRKIEIANAEAAYNLERRMKDDSQKDWDSAVATRKAYNEEQARLREARSQNFIDDYYKNRQAAEWTIKSQKADAAERSKNYVDDYYRRRAAWKPI